MNPEAIAQQAEQNDRQVIRANRALVKFNATAQRRQQVTAIALELHRSIGARWASCGTPDQATMTFGSPDERVAFDAACQHLTAVFRGENE